jgi:hypothetical protein
MKIITSSELPKGKNIMNVENQQTQFNHEDWLAQLYRFIDTGRQFINELFKGLKILSQKGMLEAWKDIRAAVSRLTPKDFIVTALITVIGIFGLMIFMTGLTLFSYQAMLWLQNGTWTEYPLFVVFNFLFDNTAVHQWMVQPESWLGLQKMISWFLESVPLSMALMIPGISIILFMAGTLVIAMTYRFYQLRNRND